MPLQVSDHPPLWLPPRPALIRSAHDLVPPAVLGLVLPGIGATVGGLAPVRIAPAYIGQDNDLNVNAVHTFTNLVPARTVSQRYVVALAYGDVTPRTIDSLTIAGVTATVRDAAGVAGGDTIIFDAVVGPGAAGNVVVDFSGANGINVVMAALYTVGDYSYRTGGGDTGTNTASLAGIAVNKGEFAIGIVHCYDGFPGAGPMSWTNLTEDNDVDYGDEAQSSAHTTVQADGTLTVTASSANGDEIQAVVSVYRY